MTTPYESNWRDRVAYRVIEFAMDRIATPKYRAFVTAASRRGLEELWKDIEEEYDRLLRS